MMPVIGQRAISSLKSQEETEPRKLIPWTEMWIRVWVQGYQDNWFSSMPATVAYLDGLVNPKR